MTIDEAIAHAREVAKRRMTECENHYDKDAHYYPIQRKKCAEEHIQLAEWLEELKQYSAIGTTEECRAAMGKQKPFKPETAGLTIGIGRCKCGAEFLDSKTNYCGNCGQKLDWEDVE